MTNTYYYVLLTITYYLRTMTYTEKEGEIEGKRTRRNTKEKEGEREGKRKRRKEKEKDREREGRGERERKRGICTWILFTFLIFVTSSCSFSDASSRPSWSSWFCRCRSIRSSSIRSGSIVSSISSRSAATTTNTTSSCSFSDASSRHSWSS